MAGRPIPPELEAHIASLLRRARVAGSDDPPAAWQLLEDAHVLAQAWAGPHVRVHLAMLRFGLEKGDLREALGQLTRVLIAGPGSLAGKFPVGNTGRARVPLSMPMPIRDDLREILGRR